MASRSQPVTAALRRICAVPMLVLWSAAGQAQGEVERTASSTQESSQAEPVVEALLSASLARSTRASDPAGTESTSTEAAEASVTLEQRLAELRARSAPILLGILGNGGVPADWSGDLDRFWRLDQELLDAIERSLLGLPLGELRRHLERLAQEEPRLAQREVGVRLLGQVGDLQDLGLILWLATPLAEGSGVLPRSVRRSLATCLGRLRERAPTLGRRILDAFEDTHPGLRVVLVEALAGGPPQQALTELASLLGRVSELDAFLLMEITRLARRVPRPVEERVCASVRGYLRSSDETQQRMALHAVGVLEDYQAVPGLLAFLPDGSDGAHGPDGANVGGARSDAAHRALCQMTGLAPRQEQNVWRAWYEHEELWWREVSPQRAQELRTGDQQHALDAVADIARRRLNRHRAAGLLMDGLVQEDPEVLRWVCTGLAQLRSLTAVPALVDLLEHPAPLVRGAAHGALVELTGRTLPPNPAAWRREP